MRPNEHCFGSKTSESESSARSKDSVCGMKVRWLPEKTDHEDDDEDENENN